MYQNDITGIEEQLGMVRQLTMALRGATMIRDVGVDGAALVSKINGTVTFVQLFNQAERYANSDPTLDTIRDDLLELVLILRRLNRLCDDVTNHTDAAIEPIDGTETASRLKMLVDRLDQNLVRLREIATAEMKPRLGYGRVRSSVSH